jgi:ubiquinone/menaquinone biosynthesis C-methylase UbiE
MRILRKGMSQLEFNEEFGREMEVVYRRGDMLRRRALVHEALGAAPGERILDAGCGPGFYVAELLERVGPQGSVVGVDGSPALLEFAARRCEGHANADFREGDVTALPVADAEFDRALSVQVLEYVADIPAVLAELRRVLKPGGRLLIWDVDWATVSWHSRDPARMERFLRAWDEHLEDPSLPRTLAARLREAGFEEVRLTGHSFATADLDEETYAGSLLELMSDYVGTDEAREWADEQRELQARGEAFFACTQFCFTATRPR